MNVKFCKKCKNHLVSEQSIRKNLCLSCREPGIALRSNQRIFQKKLDRVLELPGTRARTELLRALFKSKRQIMKGEI